MTSAGGSTDEYGRLDHPFRSVYGGVNVIQSLTDRKVRFHSLNLLVDSCTPMGKFFGTILLAVVELERTLVEMIHELRQRGMAIEQIVLWLMRQTEYPNKRRLDNYTAVEWAVAAKELGFPKQTDGKRMVKAWRTMQTPSKK